ncbi:helix-turn-helix domain-containing protein [Alkalihalobacillus sp. BA299]|uniref:helix-turn-helix domain-containing protein n=1 Tax=Alkalihalobacillus sp. BA299 TaxID=2815938 RepID=UPI001AD9B458|nr:helix-turn-helix domain-containing protein [Alkalihalobacillus sp. BA299]
MEEQINELWLQGVKIDDIAKEVGISHSYLRHKISQYREKDPEKWPRRRNKPKRPFHIYECEDCVLVFAVEQAFETQEDVCCPVCWSDEQLKDVGSGVM